MHLSSCLNPKRIYNRYIKEFMYVPCGKCDACRNRHAFTWTKRLETEMHCWKYTAFVTLTYDDDHLPLMSLVNDVYIDLNHEHSAPGSPSPCCNTIDIFPKLSSDEKKRFVSWKNNNPQVCYLSVYDCQCFIKRVRKNSLNYCKKHYESFKKEDYQVRYYLVGEYGTTTQRAHYHVLFFFSSEKQAAYFEEVVRSSWKFGLVDFSYAGLQAAHYVAAYVNSYTNLSPIYQHCKQIRPFFLCSKTPPLGTLFYDDKEIRELFNSCSPLFTVTNFKKRTFDNVPLWSTFVYRLYPRLSLFSKFSDSDRIRLYSVYEFFRDWSFSEDSGYFVDYMLRSWSTKNIGRYFSQLHYDYISALAENVNSDLKSLKNSILRWYYISARVCNQAYAWQMTSRDYYLKIKTFYENVEIEKLKSQYQFLSDFSERFNGYAIGYYRDYLDTVTSVDLADLSAAEILSLKNNRIDLDRLFSDDLSERLEYIEEIHPDNQVEFVHHLVQSGVYARQMVKNKRKNDYLQSNPLLKNKIY